MSTAMVTAADRKDQPVGWFGDATETKCIPSRRQRPVRGMSVPFGVDPSVETASKRDSSSERQFGGGLSSPSPKLPETPRSRRPQELIPRISRSHLPDGLVVVPSVPEKGPSKICGVQKDRSLNLPVFQQTMSLSSLTQRKDTGDGGTQLLFQGCLDQEFHACVDQLWLRQKDRQVQSRHRLRLLHEPPR